MTEEQQNRNSTGPGVATRIMVMAIATAFFYFSYQNVENFDFSSGELPYVNAAAESSFSTAFNTLVSEKGHGIIHLAAVKVSAKALGGVSHLAMRLPSLLFAALCILVFYSLASRLFPDGLSLMAAIVFAASPALVSAALDSGPHSLFLLLTLIIYNLLIRLPDNFSMKMRILLFLSLYFAFDTSFHAMFVIPVGCILLHYEMTRRKAERHPVPKNPGWPIAVFAAYSAVAAALVFVFYYGYGALRIPPSSIAGADIKFSQWLAILFVGAAGGSAKANASLACFAIPLVLFGVVHIRKTRPHAYKFPLFALILTPVLIALYFKSGIHPTDYPLFAGNMGYVIAIPLPFISILLAAGIYYFFVTTFRRDALSLFTIGIFLRTVFTTLIILAVFVFTIVFTVQSLRSIADLERENWPAASRYLSDWMRNEDIIMYHSQDAAPIEYFLKPRLENASPVDREPGKTGTWLIKMTPVKGFGMRPGILNKLYMEEWHNPYTGLHGILNLVYLEGTAVADRMYINVDAGAGGKTNIGNRTDLSNKKTIACPPGVAPCTFDLYFLEDDTYVFTATPLSDPESPPDDISLCGISQTFNRHNDNTYMAEKLFPRGYCKVKLIPVSGQIREYDIFIQKNAPSGIGLNSTIRIGK
ncbi:glycosyltransferase family 39 protein [bacterium]